jgi:phage terminase Nu1 subunit (DNA packaging protein)
MGAREAALPLVPRRETVKVLGVGLRTFDRLESEGVVVPARPGKGGRPSLYDLTVTVPGYIAHLGHPRGTAEDRDARARRDRSQAELNELRLARERRALLPRDQVAREGQAFTKAVQAKLRALPRRLVQAGLVPADRAPAVAALVQEAQDEMARWTSMLDLLAAGREAAL